MAPTFWGWIPPTREAEGRPPGGGEPPPGERARASDRPVALIGRAAVSKTAGWGFESLLACVSLRRRDSKGGATQVDGAATNRSGDHHGSAGRRPEPEQSEGGGAESLLACCVPPQGIRTRERGVGKTASVPQGESPGCQEGRSGRPRADREEGNLGFPPRESRRRRATVRIPPGLRTNRGRFSNMPRRRRGAPSPG